MKNFLLRWHSMLPLIILAIAWAGYFASVEFGTPNATWYAKSIVAECSKVQGDHSPCYESVIPNLYPRVALSEIFNIVREVRTLDPSYQYCHTLGHKIGERVVAEDPDNWLDFIPDNPSDGLCSNGFIHGVFEGRFGADVLSNATITQFMPQFAEACEPHDGWDPSSLDRAICYHGMGHLFVFITNADLPHALSLCSQITPSDYERVCVQGVFMQIFQPLEPSDFDLIQQLPVQPNKNNVRQFCASFKNPLYVGSCLEESWPLFTQQILNGTYVGTFCSWQPDATETDQCYISMSSIIGRETLGEPQKVVAACNNLPADRQPTCYSYSAEAALEEDLSTPQPAVSVCDLASPSVAQQCLSLLTNHAEFLFGDKTQRAAFCALMPSDLQATCTGSSTTTPSDIEYSETVTQGS